MMSENGIFFELNKNDCVQIALNAAVAVCMRYLLLF